MFDGIPHIVGDHQRRQMVGRDQTVTDFQHLFRRFGIQCRSMLIQQQYFRLFQRSHQQCQCLPLSAGQQANLNRHPVLQSQLQFPEQLPIGLPFPAADAPFQSPMLPAPGSKGQILPDFHIRRCPHHGILKYPSQDSCPFVFGKPGHILPVYPDGPLIHTIHTGHGIQKSGFSRPVAADQGDKVPFRQFGADVPQGDLLIDRPRVECLADSFNRQHLLHPPM